MESAQTRIEYWSDARRVYHGDYNVQPPPQRHLHDSGQIPTIRLVSTLENDPPRQQCSTNYTGKGDEFRGKKSHKHPCMFPFTMAFFSSVFHVVGCNIIILL